MDGIILVGGLGTRLRPLTNRLPKPALPLVNKPIIEHILDRIAPSIDQVILACSYKSAVLEDLTSRYSQRTGLPISIAVEEYPLGTGGAIGNSSAKVSYPLLVLNGDLISSLDVNAMLNTHMENEAKCTIALWEVEDPSRFGVVVLDEKGRIIRFVEKPAPGTEPSNLINAGAYILEKDMVSLIPHGKKVSIERDIFPVAIENGLKLFGYRFSGYWHDVGTPASYINAAKEILKAMGKNVYLGHNAVLDGEADGFAVLGDGTVVDGDSMVENSILMPGSRLTSASLINGILNFDTELVRSKYSGPGIYNN